MDWLTQGFSNFGSIMAINLASNIPALGIITGIVEVTSESIEGFNFVTQIIDATPPNTWMKSQQFTFSALLEAPFLFALYSSLIKCKTLKVVNAAELGSKHNLTYTHLFKYQPSQKMNT
ncbi:hypothetical protein BJ165DRAFT_1401351 [Panaeolus papilionaceus]|nr:hypothetical protein BJ165DRAFT_1401351 [Panaeolus papilionaceus]